MGEFEIVPAVFEIIPAGDDERISFYKKTRIGMIVETRRIGTSSYGNPTFAVAIGVLDFNGREVIYTKTQINSGCAYGIENRQHREMICRFSFNKPTSKMPHGSLYGVTILRQDNVTDDERTILARHGIYAIGRELSRPAMAELTMGTGEDL